MKPTPLALSALALLALLAPAARADDEDVPSFKKRGDEEKKFVEKVGAAVVRAARSAPTKVELEKFEFEDPKKDRKDLKITMSYAGGVTKKRFTSTIVVKIDSSDKEKWEVLNIDYSDNNSVSPFNPRTSKIQDLIKKLNK
jgi:hypothetical protein